MSAIGEMERKRKRDESEGQSDAVTGSDRKACGGGENTVAAEDREVDEFFAILRRMHTAYSYLKKVEGINGGGHASTERQAVRSEDDGDHNGVNVDAAVREGEFVAENAGLDLNADPLPEPDPV